MSQLKFFWSRVAQTAHIYTNICQNDQQSAKLSFFNYIEKLKNELLIKLVPTYRRRDH